MYFSNVLTAVYEQIYLSTTWFYWSSVTSKMIVSLIEGPPRPCYPMLVNFTTGIHLFLCMKCVAYRAVTMYIDALDRLNTVIRPKKYQHRESIHTVFVCANDNN